MAGGYPRAVAVVCRWSFVVSRLSFVDSEWAEVMKLAFRIRKTNDQRQTTNEQRLARLLVSAETALPAASGFGFLDLLGAEVEL